MVKSYSERQLELWGILKEAAQNGFYEGMEEIPEYPDPLWTTSRYGESPFFLWFHLIDYLQGREKAIFEMLIEIGTPIATPDFLDTPFYIGA